MVLGGISLVFRSRNFAFLRCLLKTVVDTKFCSVINCAKQTRIRVTLCTIQSSLWQHVARRYKIMFCRNCVPYCYRVYDFQ